MIRHFDSVTSERKNNLIYTNLTRIYLSFVTFPLISLPLQVLIQCYETNYKQMYAFILS